MTERWWWRRRATTLVAALVVIVVAAGRYRATPLLTLYTAYYIALAAAHSPEAAAALIAAAEDTKNPTCTRGDCRSARHVCACARVCFCVRVCVCVCGTFKRSLDQSERPFRYHATEYPQVTPLPPSPPPPSPYPCPADRAIHTGKTVIFSVFFFLTTHSRATLHSSRIFQDTVRCS